MNQINEKIHSLLRERGITQKELVKVLEMSETGYYAMIRKNSIKVSTLQKIADFLNVPCESFFINVNERIVVNEKDFSKCLKIVIDGLLNHLEKKGESNK